VQMLHCMDDVLRDLNVVKVFLLIRFISSFSFLNE